MPTETLPWNSSGSFAPDLEFRDDGSWKPEPYKRKVSPRYPVGIPGARDSDWASGWMKEVRASSGSRDCSCEKESGESCCESCAIGGSCSAEAGSRSQEGEARAGTSPFSWIGDLAGELRKRFREGDIGIGGFIKLPIPWPIWLPWPRIVKKKGPKHICGPDVTEWFRRELIKIHAITLQLRMRDPNDEAVFDYWKYGLSYKWMDFESPRGKDRKALRHCSKGKCKNTVWLAGICLRKNQLGNIAFAFSATILRQLNPNWAHSIGELLVSSVSDSPRIMLDAAYKGRSVLGITVLKAVGKNEEGGDRLDNLSAFSLGSILATKMPVWGPPGAFERSLRNYFESNRTFTKYADFLSGNQRLSVATLTGGDGSSGPGGVPTKDCKRCAGPSGRPVEYPPDSLSHVDYWLALAYLRRVLFFPYGGLVGPNHSFDGWLRHFDNSYDSTIARQLLSASQYYRASLPKGPMFQNYRR